MIHHFPLPTTGKPRDEIDALLARYGCSLCPAAFGPPVVSSMAPLSALQLDELRHELGLISDQEWDRMRGVQARRYDASGKMVTW